MAQRSANARAFVAAGALIACIAPQLPAAARPAAAKSRANVLVILADDLGYSDIAAYGSEIATPNLDRLARMGVRLTHFHSAPTCSPTRSMLLSGADLHTAGVGVMAEMIPSPVRGREGFEGVLTNRVATLAERFSAAGYRTMMAGKWHLGQADGERPAQRGFQHSLALLQGGADHYGKGGLGNGANPLTQATYLRDDRPYRPAADFYSSDAYAGSIIADIGAASGGRPFFAYLAFTAPHWPLQVPPEESSRYKGVYDGGWARLAERRIAGMRSAGVLPGTVPMPTTAFGPSQASWDALSPQQKAVESRKMEVFAGMVTRMDRDVGRVLGALQKSGQLSNTIIVFLSDNGPAGETAEAFGSIEPGVLAHARGADNSLAAIGSTRSFLTIGPNWAAAASAPSRLFKSFVTEGGTLVPTIITFKGVAKGSRNEVIGDVRDIAPTVLALTQVPTSNSVDGRKVAYLEGTDLSPWLASGKHDRPVTDVAMEFYGQASVRQGIWKLLRMPAPAGDGQWHLYDLSGDTAERNDLKAQQPVMVQQMMAAWRAYSARHHLPEAPPAGPHDVSLHPREMTHGSAP